MNKLIYLYAIVVLPLFAIALTTNDILDRISLLYWLIVVSIFFGTICLFLFFGAIADYLFIDYEAKILRNNIMAFQLDEMYQKSKNKHLKI